MKTEIDENAIRFDVIERRTVEEYATTYYDKRFRRFYYLLDGKRVVDTRSVTARVRREYLESLRVGRLLERRRAEKVQALTALIENKENQSVEVIVNAIMELFKY